MQERTDFVCSLISSLALEHDEVTGSSIGLFLRSKYPGIRIRSEYGGVRNFIDTYCAKDIIHVRKQGEDDVYRHRSKLLYDGVSSEDSETASAWRAFSDR